MDPIIVATTCATCLSTFEAPRRRGSLPKYCSAKCRHRGQPARQRPIREPTQCKQCGAQNPPQRWSGIIKYCSPLCRVRWREANRKRYDNVCGFCGELFKADRPARRFCSTSCNASFGNALRYANHEYVPKGKGHRGRAQRYGVEFAYFKDSEIFERDGWACKLCSHPINKALKWPNPWSPSLDHIVPMSLGGPHVPGNVQCAHLRCNILKGAMPDAGSASDAERAEATAR